MFASLAKLSVANTAFLPFSDATSCDSNSVKRLLGKVSEVGQTALDVIKACCYRHQNPTSTWQRVQNYIGVAALAACVAGFSAAYFMLWARENGYNLTSFKAQSFNEKTLLKKYGPSVFEFDPKGVKEKVLVLTAASDWNGAFKAVKKGYHEFFFEELLEKADVKYRTIWDPIDICKHTANPNDAIDALVIAGHGNPGSIQLSDFTLFKKGQKLPSYCFKGLKQNATISLDSCSTGKGGANSFGAYLAKASGRTVFAPIIDVAKDSLTMLFNPFRMVFADTANNHENITLITRIFEG